MSDSPRLEWVRVNAPKLLAIANEFGARRMSLCGSVGRGTDRDGSDIDFYVWEFDEGIPDTAERLDARRRANALVKTLRAMCPYRVDVCGIPGWLLDEGFKATMRQDSIALAQLSTSDGTLWPPPDIRTDDPAGHA
jgi:predicted nucleotidyltransferase